MPLPYNRPRLIEMHETEICPPILRQPIQALLTMFWTTRVKPFQSKAPYEAVVQILEDVIQDVERGNSGDEKSTEVRVVDCCSGAGGPMPLIEKEINQRRRSKGLQPTPFLLSDLFPSAASISKFKSKSLSYLPYSVDATHAPEALTSQRHFRTFNLAFHHFDDEGARRVLEDAMLTSDGIGIFELQEFDAASLFTILMLGPMTWLLTPFQRPSLSQLFFTYIIPIIPFILVVDGLVSAWRTRSMEHVLHLANLASASLAMNNTDVPDWTWECGRVQHTWPTGHMFWIVGRKVPEM